MIECSLGRQMPDENRSPDSYVPMTPPASLGSPSQRHHLLCVSSICCAVMIVWCTEFGSPPVYGPPGTLRVDSGYSSCRLPSEWPSSCGVISGPCGEPPDVVASVPPMPPYVFVLARIS